MLPPATPTIAWQTSTFTCRPGLLATTSISLEASSSPANSSYWGGALGDTDIDLFRAPAGNSHRLRTSLLDRKHHGDLRTPLLLRRVRFAGSIPARQAELLDRADRNSDRRFRGHGVVFGDFRRSGREQPRVP